MHIRGVFIFTLFLELFYLAPVDMFLLENLFVTLLITCLIKYLLFQEIAKINKSGNLFLEDLFQ